MPIEPGIELRKDNILKRVTQEQIFEAYLGLPVDTDTNYINPLRIDKEPGCRYYYNSLGKLYFKDFGSKHHWDCFAVVQYKYGCNFIEALKIIVKDFSLNGLEATNSVVQYIPPIKTRSVIKVQVRDWTKEDLQYWLQFNITYDILKLGNIHPCKAVWFGEEYYRCKSNDPCYCYYFGRDLYKLYFPKRKKGENRFIQNLSINDDMLQGLSLLPESAPYLILTKSYKDVLSLLSFGINSVAVHSEYHIIKRDLYENLHTRFPIIYTLFDNDPAGRSLSIRYRDLYNVQNLLFPMGWLKDFSDNVKQKGVD
jgi:hypothetical protein